MLSKQVKHRIARNKKNRKSPKWRARMRDFLMSQMPSGQALLSSKHVPGTTGEALVAGYTFKAKQTLERLETWTRQDWSTFIRSGDADYAQYVALRNFVRSLRHARPVVDITGDKPRSAVLQTTPDPEVLNKDFEGDEINMDLKIDQRAPRLPGLETLDLTGNADPKQLLDLVKAHPNANWVQAFVPADAKKQGE